MRFLLALRHAGYARSLQSTLRMLCEREHDVVTLLGRHAGLEGPAALVERLEAELPGLTLRNGAEARSQGKQSDVPEALRSWITYLRFLEPEFSEATKLRERAARGLSPGLREATDAAAADPSFRGALVTVLSTVERLMGPGEPVRQLIAEERPDAMLVSPLIERKSPQVAYIRAAAELGIPSALLVASWDNLTTGPVIHEPPNLVTVWNEPQRTEAVELHGIPAECVAVTGASVYDEWFDRRPSSSREQFCERVGLPPDRPFVLYVASSGFIAPDEAAWIVRWIERVRSSGRPDLADLSVLVRPHPQHRLLDGSRPAARLLAMSGVSVHPPDGARVTDESTLAVYYDSIFHAAAVVGVNTSAMIESAIVGRGVHVLVGKRYRDSQIGLPHFAHLRRAGGGLVLVTERMGVHAAGLERAIRGEDREEAEERSRSFLKAFVRPHGLDTPATPFMVSALERLAASQPVPRERLLPAGQELVARAAADLRDALDVRGRSHGP